MPMPLRDLALALLVCVVWAGNFLMSALALREMPPLLFTGLRAGAAGRAVGGVPAASGQGPVAPAGADCAVQSGYCTSA